MDVNMGENGEYGENHDKDLNKLLVQQEATEITPQKWLEMFNTLNNTLSSLSTEIRELKTFKTSLAAFTPEWKESVDREAKQIDEKIDYQDFQIRLLKNMMINQDEKINILEARLTASYQRELRPNLVIYGILESAEEDRSVLYQKVTDFFKETLELSAESDEIEFWDAYRLGQGRARPVLVKLTHVSDKAKIYSNSSVLKDKVNAKKKPYFVQDDMSEQQEEDKHTFRDLVKENKERDTSDQLTIKRKYGQLFVNNEKVKKQVTPTMKQEILRMEPDEIEQVRAVKLASGPKHSEKGSDYYSFAFKPKSKQDIQKAYARIKMKFADASHVLCAYRLDNPIGPYRQEGIDDNDIGIGRAMLQVLKKKDL